MPQVLRRAVFLDRDGVINRAVLRDGRPFPPTKLAEFEILDGVSEGCRRLKKAGFLLIVITNQPDVGRGEQKREVVEAMHARMRTLLPLDRIEVCYHSGQEHRCSRRKPAPGMITQAAADLHLDLTASFVIGDRWRDVDCGRAAGSMTIFIDNHYAEILRQQPDFRVESFTEAVNLILQLAQTGEKHARVL